MLKKTFDSPYDQYADRNGETCEVLEVEVGQYTQIHRIRFEDGFVTEAFSEELIPVED